MEVLIAPNENVLANIGEQAVFADKDYRFMKYCIMLDVEEGKLIFNGLTRTLILLYKEELNEIGNIIKYDFLYKYYFFVPEEFDEQTIVDKIKDILRKPLDDLYLAHPQQYTILTTTKCNARCFYCYELASKFKHHMSEETAVKVGQYINVVANKSMPVSLHWFGGEPLYNSKVIDIITSALRDYGFQYTSTFTTNGFLFDKDLVLKAKNIWNTIEVQITIDGTEQVYNKVKNYKNVQDISPFKKVMNNIAMLLNNGIRVAIRMNIDQHNAEDLKQFVLNARNRFGNHPNLTIYAWPIFEDDNFKRTKEEHVLIFKKLEELEHVLDQCGYYEGMYPDPAVQCIQCMADSGTSVTIDPDGNLGVCEHYIDSHFWGHIDYPFNRNKEELKIWKEYKKPLDICENCPIYPSCTRPEHCEEMGKCDEQYKEWRIRKHTQGVYRYYIKNKTNYNEMPRRLAENI